MINLQNFIQNQEHRNAVDEQDTYPNVNTLPDGEYQGKLAAHTFEYNGNFYKTEIGIKTMFPQPWTITIKDGKEYYPYIKY